MNTRELQDRIIELKKEKDVCILAHAYQSHDIWEVADYVGDSYGLSVQAAKAPQKTVIMAGVRFMAETVKVLSPEKKVLLANDLAGCTMALQMDRDKVLEMQKENPGYATVAYINTTSELKTAVDVVVTSSSAVKILKNMPEKDILFIPDCNLGAWVAKQLPEKNFKFFQGGCSTHMNITPDRRSDCSGEASGSQGSGSSGMPRIGHRTGGLCRKHHRNHELREGKRLQGIHHRHGEQHRTAPPVRMSG